MLGLRVRRFWLGWLTESRVDISPSKDGDSKAIETSGIPNCEGAALGEISFDMDPELIPIYQVTRPYNVSSVDNSYSLYQAVRYVVTHEIPGDFVECGVWKGGSSMVAAHTLLAAGSTSRRLYLYDTFAGMVEPGDRDVQSADGVEALPNWQMWQKDYFNTPEDKFLFVKGKVEDTIPDRVPESIGILRIDTDFYDSTYHELVHLFPLLSPGGVLIIDDYGSWQGCREACDKYIEENKSAILLHRVGNDARVAMKLGT